MILLLTYYDSSLINLCVKYQLNKIENYFLYNVHSVAIDFYHLCQLAFTASR